MSLDDDAKEWTLWNGANVRMSGVDVRLDRRRHAPGDKMGTE